MIPLVVLLTAIGGLVQATAHDATVLSTSQSDNLELQDVSVPSLQGNVTVVEHIQNRASRTDPSDFSWIRNWAAVGDSYTAGVGSGNLWSNLKADRACSRYDWSYATILNRFFGPTVQKFYYTACSGDDSVAIKSQIASLPTGLDLVIMTAGGNDLCLSALIWNCILSFLTTSSGCQGTIQSAQGAIDGILHANIVELLGDLDAKMSTGSVVVVPQYAQFFDTQTNECATSHSWIFPFPLPVLGTLTSNPLTTGLRRQLNTLVKNANAKIAQAVSDFSASSRHITVVTSNWDQWVQSESGTFCRPGSSPYPSHSSNEKVLFFKMPTPITWLPGLSNFAYKRDENSTMAIMPTTPEGPSPLHHFEAGNMTVEELLDTAKEEFLRGKNRRFLTRDEEHIFEYAKHMAIQARINGPACSKSFLSNYIPDAIGKIFHPNEKGHEVMASFISESVMEGRAKVLGVTSPSCSLAPKTVCYGAQGTSQNYASAYALYSKTAQFCSEVNRDKFPGPDWSLTYYYNVGTPDEVSYTIVLAHGQSAFDETACNRAMNNLLDQCDTDRSANPMNWKQGGEYTDGNTLYIIRPTRNGRPWPYPSRAKASCQGWYKFLWDQYDIYGAGFAGFDWGQDTLLSNISSCVGVGLTQWKFDYFDRPDENGFEWHASFRTQIWTKSRCFANNKVVGRAGGPDDAGCFGNG